MNDQILRSSVTSVRDLLTQLSVTDTVSISGGLMLNSATDGTWSVAVGGNTLPVIWADSVNPIDGMQCIVAIVTPAGGQSYAVMLCGVSGIPNQGERGAVVTVSTLTCTVNINGQTVTAQRCASYTPTVGDTALLLWRGGIPYAITAITLSAPAAPPATYVPPIVKPAPPPPPPPPPVTGTNNYSCTSSGTWTSGYNWNSYFGSMVYSGSGYVPPSRGTWFYGGATKSLALRHTITRVQFYLGARRPAGSYNNVVQAHFYYSTDNGKGGEPNITGSAYNLNIAPGWGGGWITLPTSFGTSLKNGGSITIAGDPYIGFQAGSAQPSSGALKISWSS